MKVLMQGRFGLLEAAGGDRIQVENTAAELEKIGVNVDISCELDVGLQNYDIVHVFQLDWTAETHLMAKNAKKYDKPLVLSPIHHKVAEVKRFDDEYVFDYRRMAKHLFKKQHSRDTFKNVYRCLANPKKIYPTMYSVFKGLKNMHRSTIEMADVVLVQTELEAEDLKNTYGVDFKWVKVPNGVSEKFLYCDDPPQPLGIKDYIFSVGRIEPRKDQLNIIKAVVELRIETKEDLKLVFVGKKNPKNHIEYTRIFDKYLRDNTWITYIDSVPYDDIPAYFYHAKVCVSASWFESTGLTLLEALYCGTNAVASSPRAKEILGDYASYCEPGNVRSIKEAIKKEFYAERPLIDQEMRKEYTWKNAAAKTKKVYEVLLQ